MGVQEGEYIMEVRYIGYQSTKVNVIVEAGTTVKMDIELQHQSISGEEVKVTAQAEGQMQAINQQITSKTITNVVSQKKIQALPEANAAEAVGRLPGVSLERSGGEGTKVNIRGMGAKYTKVQIDGVNMTATGSGDRSADLSMISPYMLQGIELTKSIMANQEATATGGIVNFRIKKAPEKPSYNALVQGGANSLRNTYTDNKFSFGGSHRFLSNLLGIYGQIDYENKDAGSQQLGDVEFDQETDGGTVKTNTMRLKDIYRENQRLGAALVLDFTLPSTEFKLSNFYSRIRREEWSYQNYYGFEEQTFRISFNDTPERWMTVLTNSLRIDHRWKDWQISTLLSHSYSEDVLPSGYSSTNRNWPNNPFPTDRNSTYNVDLDPETIPDLITIDPIEKATEFMQVGDISHSENETNERDLAAELNITNSFALTDQLKFKVTAGAKFKHKTKMYENEQLVMNGQIYWANIMEIFDDQLGERTKDAYYGGQKLGIYLEDFLDDDYDGGEFFDGRYDLGNVMDKEMFRIIKDETLKIKNLEEQNEFSPVLYDFVNSEYWDYDGTEDYQAYYLMPEISFTSKLLFVPGVRYEANKTEYTGYRGTRLGVLRPWHITVVDTVTKTRENDFLLPMIQTFYTPTEWLTLKAGYTHTLQRPNYDQIRPSYVISNQGEIGNLGNFRLKPELSKNWDLQLSIFSDKVGLLSIGAFRKDITDMIFWTGRTVVDDTSFFELPSNMNRKVVAYAKNNEKESLNYGFELEWQSNFWYLPGLLSGIVINVNYTRNESEAHYIKSEVKTGVNPDFTTYSYAVDTTLARPMINQPDHLLNLTLGYDYKGFSIRWAFRYKSKIFTTNSWYDDLLGYSTDFYRYDLSIKQKTPIQGLEAFLNINNITNEYEHSVIQHMNFTNYKEYYGRTMSLGFRYVH